MRIRVQQLWRLAPVGLALVGLAAAAARPVQAAGDLSCAHVPDLVRSFLRYHVTERALTPELEQRTIDTHLRRLDSSRTLLTRNEVEGLRGSLAGVFERIARGDCSQLTDLHKQLVRHHERTAKFVREFVLSDRYKIDESAVLVLDPEDRGYPATPEARDDLLRRWAHFQMSTYVANGTPFAEAQKKLVERYDRRLRRVLEISPDEIYEAWVDAFAASLDPHSNYLSRQVLEDFKIGMSLSLEGIGVALSEQDGYAVAERIIPGGAADKAQALRPKDKIIAVAEDGGDFVDIIDMPLREAVGLIRGKKGTKVGLTILREGDTTERFNVTIVRDKISLEDQAASLRFEEREVGSEKLKLAVLELPSFYGDSNPSKRQATDDVARLLRQVNEQEADGLLLDLSRNGGGLLQHAVTISGFFIREGAIVAIENSEGDRQIQRDLDGRTLYAGPVVVLTSRVSASAAEILAGALKDYRRALIVGGDHTFGKGTVQTVSPLPQGAGALKITTQIFYRPGGLSTQHDGVDADIEFPSPLAVDEIGEKSQRYSLKARSTLPFLSDSANDGDPERHWRPLSDALIDELRERSRERVATSAEFAEILAKNAERREDGGVVELSEFLAEREQARAEARNGAAEADPPPPPELGEALEVLKDLVVAYR